LEALILNCRGRIKKLRALAQDPSVDLWALDEVHFQQHGSRCRMWVPAEVKDPILLHAPTRKSVGYFGAVRLRDGKLLTKREEKVFDANTFWQFLKLLRQVSSRSARRVVVISDNAKYHHALLHQQWRQQLQPQFALHFLPPYSPQLNPTERIWKLTRRLCLHNVFFAHLQEISDRVEQQFSQWKNPNDTLRKLCTLT
jgi:transposase